MAGTDRLGQLETWSDTYRDANGEDPGVFLMSTRVFRALAAGTQMQTQLINGGARNASESDAQNFVSGAGLSPILRYDRRVSVDGVSTKALPDDKVFLLPAPVGPNDWQSSQLGATFWVAR